MVMRDLRVHVYFDLIGAAQASQSPAIETQAAFLNAVIDGWMDGDFSHVLLLAWCLKVDNGSNRFPLMHQVKCFVDALEWHGVGDEGIELNITAHGVFNHAR